MQALAPDLGDADYVPGFGRHLIPVAALPVQLALLDVPVIAPALGQGLVCKIPDSGCPLVDLLMLLLHLGGLHQQRAADVRFLAQLVVNLGLGPDLVDGLVIQPVRLVHLAQVVLVHLTLVHIDGPEPTVACAVSQKLRLVAGTKEHAPARVLLCVLAVAGPVPVLALADELFSCLGFALVQGCQLAQLDDPDPA